MHWYARDKEVPEAGIERLLTDKRRVVLANDPRAGSKYLFLAESGLLDGKCNGDQQPRVKTFPYGVLMADKDHDAFPWCGVPQRIVRPSVRRPPKAVRDVFGT